jgi:hypothetical protein
MSVLGEVFGSLGSMSQLQLLLAFVACAGYAFAQGNLLPEKGRRVAWAATAIAAIGFAIESENWTFAAMLLGFAVAGLGTFVALVWITSRALGFGQNSAPVATDSMFADSALPALPEPRPRPPQATGPAHFV